MKALRSAVAAFACCAAVAPALGQQYFKGYPCTIDCSGHEAGYQWAAARGIDDPDDCGGNSPSFIEGCQAYAEEYGDDPDDWDDERRIDEGECEDEDEDWECD